MVNYDLEIAKATAFQSLKTARQTTYDLAKKDASYSAIHEDIQRLYEAMCYHLGATPEPVFDRDEYEKSQRYRDILEGRIR